MHVLDQPVASVTCFDDRGENNLSAACRTKLVAEKNDAAKRMPCFNRPCFKSK